MSDLSPEAEELLRQARRAFSPSEDQLHVVRSALKAQIGASLNTPASSASVAGGFGAPALGAAGWSAGHTALAAVVIGAIGAGALAMWPSTSRPPGSATAPAELVAQPQPASGLTEAEEAEPSAASTPPTLNPEPAAQEPASSDRSSERGAPPALRGAARARAKPEAVPAAAGATDSLAEEVHMLRQARSALDRGDAAHALKLLDAHEMRFRRGTLHEERLATRVQALCTLGLVDRARAVARELERAAPRSPHLARVRASCIAGPANR
jgi:hypothetical protein